MRSAWFTSVFLLSAALASSEDGNVRKLRRDHVRVSVERVMTGAAVGTSDVLALQIDGELFYIRSFGVGFSLRKEGNNVTDGWGLGLHTARTFFGDRPVAIVGEAGVRWYVPTAEYFRFQYRERDGEVLWQRWDRPSANAWPSFIPYDNLLEGGAVSPVFGAHARRFVGPFAVRVGVRATLARFGSLTTYRSPGGDAVVVNDGGSWKMIFAPVVSVGF